MPTMPAMRIVPAPISSLLRGNLSASILSFSDNREYLSKGVYKVEVVMGWFPKDLMLTFLLAGPDLF